MLIRELIHDRFGLAYMNDELATLDRLSGKQLAFNTFDNEIDRWMRAWGGQTATYLLSRYLLPIGQCDHRTVGIHLLPPYVAQRRCVVVQFDPESDRLMDHAHSMRGSVHRALLDAETEGEDIDAALVIAQEIFGEAAVYGD